MLIYITLILRNYIKIQVNKYKRTNLAFIINIHQHVRCTKLNRVKTFNFYTNKHYFVMC